MISICRWRVYGFLLLLDALPTIPPILNLGCTDRCPYLNMSLSFMQLSTLTSVDWLAGPVAIAVNNVGGDGGGNNNSSSAVFASNGNFTSADAILGCSLTNLLLPHNSITGPLPASLSSLTLLEKLIMSYNELTGTWVWLATVWV